MVMEISSNKMYLLDVSNLQTYFFMYGGLIKAVEDISFSLRQGELLGIVGESGCGKSVLARSILRLIPDPPGRIVGGKIYFDGQNILERSEKEMQKIRGNQISMIFQEPMTSLNPVFTIGNQISELFIRHQKKRRKEAWEDSVEILKKVGIPSPEIRVNEYPFQLSGGMRQRVVIAMALACRPKIVLADEPTTSLDVTIQAQILDLMREFQKELGTAIILITHDLGVIAEMAQRVLVMYTGRVLEEADVDALFNEPLHPYTQGLISSVPTLDTEQHMTRVPLQEVPGVVPDMGNLPQGCAFYPRCLQVMEVCQREVPEWREINKGHSVRCWKFH
jgi:oligopeptide/dipeptide ABC transporter ATP-binding protein